MAVAITPSPLPGKVVPTPPVVPPSYQWDGKPLVQVAAQFGNTPQSLPYEGVLPTGDFGLAKGPAAFLPVPDRTLEGAVERASSAASKLTISFAASEADARAMGLPNPLELTGTGAYAVLQAADGAYWIAALANTEAPAWASVDTGRANLQVTDVTQLHPDVRAVVGGHSWVNFTDEQVAPTLAS